MADSHQRRIRDREVFRFLNKLGRLQLLDQVGVRPRRRWDYTLTLLAAAGGLLVLFFPPETPLKLMACLAITLGLAAYPLLHLWEWFIIDVWSGSRALAGWATAASLVLAFAGLLWAKYPPPNSNLHIVGETLPGFVANESPKLNITITHDNDRGTNVQQFTVVSIASELPSMEAERNVEIEQWKKLREHFDDLRRTGSSAISFYAPEGVPLLVRG